MKMLQVRNVPEELHRDLKVRAAKEGVTLSELVLRELPRIANRPSLGELLQRVREREPVTGGPSSAELVRAAREERDQELMEAMERRHA